MSDGMTDPKRIRQILRLQVYAIKRGIPMMVFADENAMRVAGDNMLTGAIMNKMFDDGREVFIPEQRHRI